MDLEMDFGPIMSPRPNKRSEVRTVCTNMKSVKLACGRTMQSKDETNMYNY